MFGRLLSGVCLAALLFTVGGCDDDDDDNGPSSDAVVRFMNGIPDAGELIFSVNNDDVATNVSFQEVSICTGIRPGDKDFSFTEQGGAVPLLVVPGVVLGNQQRFTFVSTGTRATPTSLLLNDAFTTPATGRALLRAININPTIGPVDAFVIAPGTPLGVVAVPNIGFNIAMGFVDIPDGPRQVVFTNSGTLNVVAQTPTFTASQTTPVTVFLTTGAGGVGVGTVGVTRCP